MINKLKLFISSMKKALGEPDIILEPTIEWLDRPPATSCLTSDHLEYGLREVIRSLYGEFGASAPLQVEQFSQNRARLRVPRDTAPRVSAALTLCTQLLDAPCVVHVQGRPASATTAGKRYFVA